MKFEKNTPKVDCLKDLQYFSRFLQLGQEEFCNFLKNFLNLEHIRIHDKFLFIKVLGITL